MTTPSRLALAAALTAVASTAFAHAKPIKSDPAAGGEPQDKSNLELTFNEEISGKLSGAEVKDAAGAKVASSSMADQGNKGLMVMLKAPLKAGDYKVDWHAVSSDDGHKTTGSYSFTVK